MRIRVLLFGVLRELAGQAEREIAVRDGASVAEVVSVVQAEMPGQTTIWRSLAVAINQEYARREDRVHEGDVVALLPPVSGGSTDDAFRSRCASNERVCVRR